MEDQDVLTWQDVVACYLVEHPVDPFEHVDPHMGALRDHLDTPLISVPYVVEDMGKQTRPDEQAQEVGTEDAVDAFHQPHEKGCVLPPIQEEALMDDKH